MVFTEYLAACVARLRSDAYFGSPTVGLPVSAADALDLGAFGDEALARLGVCGVVDLIEVAALDAFEARVLVQAQFYEIPQTNRWRAQGDDRPVKNAHEVAEKALSLWRHWTPDAGAWAPMRFESWRLAEANEELGLVRRELTMSARTMLTTVAEVLGGPGLMLAGADGAGLAVSP